jgi:phosphonate transport system ATP-binding protein
VADERPIVEARDLVVTYTAIPALDHLSLDVRSGEFVAVIGPSGAGKTTLLRCITGFVRPRGGVLRVCGVDVTRARGRALRELRRRVATVHQAYHLVERASAFDNALMGRLGAVPTLPSLLGWFPESDRRLTFSTLAELGLAERALQRVDTLSGGERQRVAVARALVQQPTLVLADEPAASLDVSLTRQVLETLRALNRDRGVTVIVNLHDLGLARTHADRILALRAGRLVFDGLPERLGDAIEEEIYRAADPRAAPGPKRRRPRTGVAETPA